MTSGCGSDSCPMRPGPRAPDAVPRCTSRDWCPTRPCAPSAPGTNRPARWSGSPDRTPSGRCSRRRTRRRTPTRPASSTRCPVPGRACVARRRTHLDGVPCRRGRRVGLGPGTGDRPRAARARRVPRRRARDTRHGTPCARPVGRRPVPRREPHVAQVDRVLAARAAPAAGDPIRVGRARPVPGSMASRRDGQLSRHTKTGDASGQQLISGPVDAVR